MDGGGALLYTGTRRASTNQSCSKLNKKTASWPLSDWNKVKRTIREQQIDEVIYEALKSRWSKHEQQHRPLQAAVFTTDTMWDSLLILSFIMFLLKVALEKRSLGWLNRLEQESSGNSGHFFLISRFLLWARLRSRPGVVNISSSRPKRLVGAPTTFIDFIIDLSFRYQCWFMCETDGNSRYWTRFTHQTRLFAIRAAPKAWRTTSREDLSHQALLTRQNSRSSFCPQHQVL